MIGLPTRPFGHLFLLARTAMHKHWVKVVAVVLMLAAMAWYILSEDESLQVAPPPEGPTPVPAEAPAP